MSEAVQLCPGQDAAGIPAEVNLGLSYGVPANQASLTFALWDGSRWTDVPTARDSNPAYLYISATIRTTGPYAAYQRPQDQATGRCGRVAISPPGLAVLMLWRSEQRAESLLSRQHRAFDTTACRPVAVPLCADAYPHWTDLAADRGWPSL